MDLFYGFICINSEQIDSNCFDYGVQYCCPKQSLKNVFRKILEHLKIYQKLVGFVCKNYKIRIFFELWSKEPNWPLRHLRGLCLDRLARRRRRGRWVWWVGGQIGFWCLSEENNDIGCEDYKISWCCPELHDGEQSWKNLNSYFLTNSKSFFF